MCQYRNVKLSKDQFSSSLCVFNGKKTPLVCFIGHALSNHLIVIRFTLLGRRKQEALNGLKLKVANSLNKFTINTFLYLSVTF